LKKVSEYHPIVAGPQTSWESKLRLNVIIPYKRFFSKVPTRYVRCSDKKGMVDTYGYYDHVRDRQALYISFSCDTDTLGFYLDVQGHNIAVVNNNIVVLEYDAEVLESSLLSKHS